MSTMQMSTPLVSKSWTAGTGKASLRARLGVAALAVVALAAAGPALAAQTTPAGQPSGTQLTSTTASAATATAKPHTGATATMKTSKATLCAGQAHSQGLTGSKYTAFVQSCTSKG